MYQDKLFPKKDLLVISQQIFTTYLTTNQKVNFYFREEQKNMKNERFKRFI